MRLVLFSALLLLAAGAPASDWQPLYEHVDPDLQAALERRLNSNREWARLIRSRKMAIGLVDMSGEEPRFARVNGNQMMYAASLPKIAILLGVYASLEDGSIEESDAIRRDLDDMIRVSSNSAATRLIDLVGMEKIQAVLKDPRYGLYDEGRGGGLWVGKRYAASGKRVGDPLHNISHGATATQVCRFFYLLASGRLINEQRSMEMLANLEDPGLHHKFVAPVEERAPNARLFRKSGTWRNWHSDAIMVHGRRWRNYILVGLIESQDGEQILRNVLPAVEEMIMPRGYDAATQDPGSPPAAPARRIDQGRNSPDHQSRFSVASTSQSP